MPLHCCVPGCTGSGYRFVDDHRISFHCFPNDGNLLKQWIHAIRRNPGVHFNLNKHTKICSLHFTENDFKYTLARKRLLVNNALPSKFLWTKSPKKSSVLAASQSAVIATDEHSENKSRTGNADDKLGSTACRTELLVDTIALGDCQNTTDIPQTVEEVRSIYEEKLVKVKLEYNVKIQTLESEIQSIKDSHTRQLKIISEDVEILKNEVASLERKCSQNEFSVTKFLKSNNDIAFYTGFPDPTTFLSVFEFLDPGDKSENIVYWKCAIEKVNLQNNDNSSQNNVKLGRPRSLEPLEEFFLVMCRLRQGFAEQHLANLYNVSVSTVSRIIITWVNYMFLKFGCLDIWPSKDVIKATMPLSMKEKYPSTRVILDCTEIKCEMPSSLILNTQLFSHYKNHVTMKGLIGIAPSGGITFVSQLYTGSISDREIVKRSGFLNMDFDVGDSVMADKGFTISDLLKEKGVSLNIPPFLERRGQLDADEVAETQEIASERIHVERAINKIKNFHIWDRLFPLSMFGCVNQMWTVCALLCNFQDPIISV
ncbi:uncharacterized protein LOC144435776 [Glandiceps talaboti]